MTLEQLIEDLQQIKAVHGGAHPVEVRVEAKAGFEVMVNGKRMEFEGDDEAYAEGWELLAIDSAQFLGGKVVVRHEGVADITPEPY